MGSEATGRSLPLVLGWKKTCDAQESAPALAYGQTSSVPSDEELIQQLKSGDGAALGTLVDRHSRIVLGVGHRILRDSGESEELVQEVFLYLYQKASLFDPARGSAKNWIIQIAYHRALERRTRLARHRFYDGTDIEEIEDNLKGGVDIEQALGAQLDRERLRSAFQDLSERQRMTLELFFFQGLTLREISAQLDEPLANIRHHYYRGLGKLRNSAIVASLRKV